MRESEWISIFIAFIGALSVLLIVYFLSRSSDAQLRRRRRERGPNKNVTKGCHIKWSSKDRWQKCRGCDPCGFGKKKCGVTAPPCCGCAGSRSR